MTQVKSDPFADVRAFLQPKLRLFLSADLVGSTKLKQSGFFPLDPPKEDEDLKSLGPKWFSPVAGFYLDFESLFANRWAQYNTDTQKPVGWTSGPDPVLWKTNGDELLYVKEINQPDQIYSCIIAWMEAIREYREILKQNKSPLDVKGTAWIAGFPIANHEIIFRSSVKENSLTLDTGRGPQFNHFYYLEKEAQNPGENGLIQDFIGPSIDTGFRLATYATPRRFPISIETALVLSTVAAPPTVRLKIYFAGKHELKGVLGGKPYPIFWIDTTSGDGLIRSEDKITKHPDALAVEDIRDFCELFISDNEQFLFRPFIHACNEASFQNRPSNYDARLNALSARWVAEKEKFKIEQESIAGNTPPDDESNTSSPSEGDISAFASGITIADTPKNGS
ncbi:MAG TPA: hypothetical protein VGN05_00310 [Parvibaculum sp.]|jgi:hypothetical protein